MEPYNSLDQRIHLLCQLIAKANRTFVSKRDDDSHTNLYFDSINNRILGRWIEQGTAPVLFSLHLDDLQIEVLDQGYMVSHSTSVVNKTLEEIEIEMEQWLPELGLNVNGFRDPLHYEIPTYSFEKEPFGELNKVNLEEWVKYRKLANQLSSDFLGFVQVEGEVRIWPHHFDTGIYFELQTIGIGFGLAMQDEMAGAPYFYMSGYPKTGSVDYSNPGSLTNGRWEIHENYQGAILPIADLSGLSEEEQYEKTSICLKEAFSWFMDNH
ncbi:MAG: hypothetical protein AAF391_03610 [Bacteroidota bacterium]